MAVAKLRSRPSPPTSTAQPPSPPPPLSTHNLSLHTALIPSPTTSSFLPRLATPTTTIASYLTSSPSSSFRSAQHIRPYCPHSRGSPPTIIIRRQPSSVDLALLDERHSSPIIGLGLSMFEPRPVTEVPVSVGTSYIFDGTPPEEEKQTFVMGGIFEVMEGDCS